MEKIHYYCKCGDAKRKRGCQKKAAKKDWIERAAVLNTVSRVLRDDEISRIAERLVALQDSEDLLLPSLRRQLAEVEKGLENLLDAIQQGLLTPSTRKRLDRLEEQKESLEVSILEAELSKPKYTKEDMVAYISQFKHGNPEDKAYQRRIIDTFVNSIYLFDDKVVSPAIIRAAPKRFLLRKSRLLWVRISWHCVHQDKVTNLFFRK